MDHPLVVILLMVQLLVHGAQSLRSGKAVVLVALMLVLVVALILVVVVALMLVLVVALILVVVVALDHFVHAFHISYFILMFFR